MAKRGKNNIIFILIIMALISYILYDKGVFDGFKKSGSLSNQDQIVLEENTDKTTKEENFINEVPKDESGQTESCEVAVLREVTDKDTKYVKGAVLTSFSAGVSFSEAKNIVENYNYTIENEASAKTRFESGQKWFVIGVGNGNEFRAICKLRENGSVKYAFIEPLFELHE